MKKQKQSKEAEIIARMRKSYALARKQMKKALRECNVGTAVYLQHVRALADLDAAERDEEIKLGLSPSNLGALVQTHFTFVAHSCTVPTTAAALERILGTQMRKAAEGLCVSDEDVAIRRQLEEEFPDGKRN